MVTDELAAQLGTCTEVLRAQDDGVDHTEQRDQVGHIVAVRELVQDDTEAVLLAAHRLRGGQGSVCGSGPAQAPGSPQAHLVVV